MFATALFAHYQDTEDHPIAGEIVSLIFTDVAGSSSKVYGVLMRELFSILNERQTGQLINFMFILLAISSSRDHL